MTKTIRCFDELIDAAPEIEDSLYKNHLVVIKGLEGLTTSQHVAFGKQYGSLEVPLPNTVTHPTEPFVEVLKRTGDEDIYSHTVESNQRPAVRKPSSFYWHADRSFLQRPSLTTVTHLVTAPHQQGDTEFFNTDLAYTSLDKMEQDVLDGITGIHSYAYYHEILSGEVYSAEEIEQKKLQYPPVEHPMIQEHPVTGETVLYISPLTLSGFTDPKRGEEASEIIHNMLNTYTEAFHSHVWNEGDIVVWDNYGVLHRGSPSRGKRELQRLTVAQ
jgi:alpha-ketoglutarate-dependent taurine dioxygenase